MRQVVKRNGKLEKFDEEKIINVIKKALEASNVEIPNNDKYYSNIINIIAPTNKDIIHVENIQDSLEKYFMSVGEYEVAKNFILYREKHKEDRILKETFDLFKDYSKAPNAATGSKFDANANVTSKNIATMAGELPKGLYIRLNRKLLTERIKTLYGKPESDKYLNLLTNHFIYKNDETNSANYCASITMYPWLLEGTKRLGGNSTPPTNLKSFCGGFVNLVFMVSGMLSGAVATPEFLMYLSWFLEKEYGKDYINKINDIVELSIKHRTLDKVITDCFEQIVYSLNQPTGARNYQAVFWNISYYDKYYFEGIFGDFKFPDGTSPIWENLSWIQKRFMKWFNNERKKTLLTFPVETMALLTDGEKPKDIEWSDYAAEMYSEGHSFFTYMSDSADSLSSCCRLRNEISENEFSYTLGAGGVSTGSKSVLTINLNRCVQYAIKNNIDYKEFIADVVDSCHKYQIAYNENLKEMEQSGMLPLFDSGYINMSRQYLTIGINGLVESAEFLKIDITPNDTYTNYVEEILSIIEFHNKKYRTKELMFNCEMIPAENVGVKHAKWDKEDGYFVPRDCYNSYFYKVEDETLNIIDKFKLHGEKFIKHLTGGSANHINLTEHLSKEQYKQVFNIAAKEKCNYFTFNIPNTYCEDCGYIDKRMLNECPHCHSKNVDYITRIIGYIKLIKNFSLPRQTEASQRYYLK